MDYYSSSSRGAFPTLRTNPYAPAAGFQRRGTAHPCEQQWWHRLVNIR
ncbi:MAG: hypothetical protein H9W81_12665 [Enterococcus sp.]|nr:hypothetical protein [Enterococcus sp.]